MTLEVSGGGSVAVETEDLLGARRELREVAQRVDGIHGQVRAALACTELATGAAAQVLARAENELADAVREAELLACELEAAAEAYGWAERVVLAQQQLLARLVGPVPELGALLVALGVSAAQHSALTVGDPQIVAALRHLADAVNLPGLVVLVRALPGDALEETAVTASPVTASAPRIDRAPGGFGDLAKRIPPAQAGQPQLRVEKYTLPDGEHHWIVYSAGTIDWSLEPGTEPWDDTSNVVGVAGGSAGSTRAAIEALKRAGWKSGEPVVPVGHSQGGIVATAIATSGVAPVPAVVTFGSPTAGVRVPRGTVDVAVEHTDDPVPALGGSPRPLVDARLLVREATPADARGSGVLPAHELTGYARTAAEMDVSSDPRLVAARGKLAAFTGGGPAEVTLWRGERLSEGQAAGSGAGR
ncbi:hypothetical protein GCM10022288_17610 [Gryllotalpicola kribbensis]|uniref:Alpha/beta hydrolase n=1 Tax=Gryllotalpicola kribbensis TaxID=993084 RepID=A0ABP8ATA2_9MICO